MVFDDPFRSFAAVNRDPMDVKELGRESSIAGWLLSKNFRK
jgi:hypothetical protein